MIPRFDSRKEFITRDRNSLQLPASVDPFTETQIQESLDEVMEARTAIVIAHRLSTIKHSDRIIVMADGRIIEEGDHESLLTQSGHYAELYNTYFRHQSLSAIEAPGWLEETEGVSSTAD